MKHVMQLAEQDRLPPEARSGRDWVEHVLGTGYHRYCPGQAWAPAVNLYEDRSCYFVVVELAGVQPNEIDLTVEGGTMFLRGQRATPSMPRPRGRVHMHLMEIDHGTFTRQIKLPEDADIEAIKAHYGQEGYLRVHIPRKR